MRRALFVSLGVLAVGCVTSQTYRLDQNVRPVRAPSSVAVLEEAPERPYTVIARVESHTDAVFKGFKDLRTEIVGRAARLGGDAVIVGPEVKETSFLILTTGMIPCEQKKLAGEVIVFHSSWSPRSEGAGCPPVAHHRTNPATGDGRHPRRRARRQ